MLETFRLIAHRAAVWFVAMRQREYRRPHSPAPHSSTPSVFNWNIPSPAAFLGRAVFLCTVPLSLLSRSRRTGAKKAALRQCFYGTFVGKVSLKLLRRIIVEACQVGDYRSYFLLTHTAPAPAHTPAQPDHRRQPMRWTPLRTIAEVTPVLYPAPVAAPSLAEYSKGSSTLCDGHPFG